MTQLNLLPDVKIDFLKTTRNKRLVIGIATLVIAVSVGSLLVMGTVVYGLQKYSLKQVNKDIQTYNNQLKATKDLDKVLTVQNQLTSLTGLHDNKAAATRIFNYLKQLTPNTAGISDLDVDYTANSMTVTGGAASLDVINTYIDTLKFTTYQAMSGDGTAPSGNPNKAFSNVVLTQFSRDDTGAKYTIGLSYDPIIFKTTENVKLSVPKIVSTRSQTDKPTDLFQQPAQSTGGQQ
jgi:hypothetical protein